MHPNILGNWTNRNLKQLRNTAPELYFSQPCNTELDLN